MDSDRRNELLSQMLELEVDIYESKGKEYARDSEDVLASMKDIGEQVKSTCDCGKQHAIGARAALMVYYLKHVHALVAHAQDPSRKVSESLPERVVDLRVFPLMYLALDEDDA